jgi:uncharacterized protein GlcG (DUF336 family)
MNRSGFIFLACWLVTVSALPVRADDSLVTFKSLSPAVALELAQATLADCRKKDYQVAVAVVDRMGVTQVLLRDRYAGPHTPDTSRRKAWTAISFRTDTLTLAEKSGPDSPQSGARSITGALLLGGGIPVLVSGSVVGGVGVSGAPTAAADHGCAVAGIEAVAVKLELDG